MCPDWLEEMPPVALQKFGQFTLAKAAKQYLHVMNASQQIKALLDTMAYKDLTAVLHKITTNYTRENTDLATIGAEEFETETTENTYFYVNLFFERIIEKTQTDVAELQINGIIDIERGASCEIINSLQTDKRRLIATILTHRYLRDNTRFYDSDSYLIGALEYELHELQPVYESILAGTFAAT